MVKSPNLFAGPHKSEMFYNSDGNRFRVVFELLKEGAGGQAIIVCLETQIKLPLLLLALKVTFLCAKMFDINSRAIAEDSCII